MKDDDWGDLDDFDNDKKPNLNKPITLGKDNKADNANSKRQNLFFGGQDDGTDLDDIPELGGNFPGMNEDKFNKVMSSSKEGGGLLASIGLKKDELNKEESLYESQEEDPHKKSNFFDNSKDRIGDLKNKGDAAQQSDDSDIDIGFNNSPKEKDGNKKGEGAGTESKDDFPDNDAAAFEAELAAGMSENEDGPITEEQQ